MEAQEPVLTTPMVVGVDPVAAGGLIAHLLRAGADQAGLVSLCEAPQKDLSVVVVDMRWDRIPPARRCPRCHACRPDTEQ